MKAISQLQKQYNVKCMTIKIREVVILSTLSTTHSTVNNPKQHISNHQNETRRLRNHYTTFSVSDENGEPLVERDFEG